MQPLRANQPPFDAIFGQKKVMENQHSSTLLRKAAEYELLYNRTSVARNQQALDLDRNANNYNKLALVKGVSQSCEQLNDYVKL